MCFGGRAGHKHPSFLASSPAQRENMRLVEFSTSMEPAAAAGMMSSRAKLLDHTSGSFRSATGSGDGGGYGGGGPRQGIDGYHGSSLAMSAMEQQLELAEREVECSPFASRCMPSFIHTPLVPARRPPPPRFNPCLPAASIALSSHFEYFLPPHSWPTVALSPHIASLPSSLQVGDVHALVEQLTGDNARLHRELAEHNKVGGLT